MPKRYLGANVFEAAVRRMIEIYKKPGRIMLSFSGGKDSTVCLEIMRLAARHVGIPTVEVVMWDDEIMFPGTFEYADRVANFPDIKFHWITAKHAMINIFNRKEPYWWVFDPLLDSSQWVRQPPPGMYIIEDQDMYNMVRRERYPPANGGDLYSVIGLRTSEAPNRRAGIFSSRGYLAGIDSNKTRKVRPIYDWKDGDVWKAIKEFDWDYNHAYDAMAKLGVPRNRLRIAPPLMTKAGMHHLQIASMAWPRWFDRVCKRCPGVRLVASFGGQVISPSRRLGESWERCYQRQCIDEAPGWIADRAIKVREEVLHRHSMHSTAEFAEVRGCPKCRAQTNSWEKLTNAIYMGDPYCLEVGTDVLDYAHPEMFRPGGGRFGKARADQVAVITEDMDVRVT